MVEFFRQLPFIAHWTKNQIEKLALDFNLKTFNRNQIIFNQGDEAKNIYIVAEGDFEVTRKKLKRKGDKSIDILTNHQMRKFLGPEKGAGHVQHKSNKF
jgi:CRP-like cAMP-binding protein